MKRKTYQVTFSGRLVGGLDKKGILANLSILFRKNPEKIRKAFNASGAVIAECASREEADRYAAAIRRAGAICEIRELEERSAKPEIPVFASSDKDSAAPRKIDPIGGGTDLALAPMSCSRIGGTPDNLTTNRPGRTAIPYAQLTMISIFKGPERLDEIMILLFEHGARRPLMIEAGSISFSDFPAVAGINLISSLRKFLDFLSRKNPAIVFDRETAEFMAGEAPAPIAKDPISLASDLDRAYSELAPHVQ